MSKKKPHPLVGRTVKAVRPMTKQEAENEFWNLNSWETPVVIEFDDGSKAYASCDMAGNGPGVLFVVDRRGMKFREVVTGVPANVPAS